MQRSTISAQLARVSARRAIVRRGICSTTSDCSSKGRSARGKTELDGGLCIFLLLDSAGSRKITCTMSMHTLDAHHPCVCRGVFRRAWKRGRHPRWPDDDLRPGRLRRQRVAECDPHHAPHLRAQPCHGRGVRHRRRVCSRAHTLVAPILPKRYASSAGAQRPRPTRRLRLRSVPLPAGELCP